MRPQPAAVAAKTIDVLILETMARYDCAMSARELANLWGEDRTRIDRWLDKFLILGLIRFVGPCGADAQYRAKPVLVEEYLSARGAASPSS